MDTNNPSEQKKPAQCANTWQAKGGTAVTGRTTKNGGNGGVANRAYDGVLTPTTTERQPHGKQRAHPTNTKRDCNARATRVLARRDSRCAITCDCFGKNERTPGRVLRRSTERAGVAPYSCIAAAATPELLGCNLRDRDILGTKDSRAAAARSISYSQRSRTIGLSINPSRYSFNSCLRMSGVGLGQFWPDALPIVWAKITPGYLAMSSHFDCNAAPNRDRANVVRPLPYQLRLCTYGNRQISFTAVFGKISGKLHALSISESLNKLQVLFEAPRSFHNLSAPLVM